MVRILVIAILLAFLAACGGSGYGTGAGVGVGPGVYPGGGPPLSSAADATFSLNIVNADSVDYALWIQWQDGSGTLNQDFVALLPAAPPGGSSQITQEVPVFSGVPYKLLLLDPAGTPWDAVPLGSLNFGDVFPVNFTVINSAFFAS